MVKRVKKRVRRIPITKAVAAKVLEVVDAGLSKGMGYAKPGQMCIEAAVCYAMGEPHTDNPRCVTQGIRDAKIEINDWGRWYLADPDGRDADSDKVRLTRSKVMRRLAIAQLGSKGAISDQKWNDALREYLWAKNPRKKEYEKGYKAALATLTTAMRELKSGKPVDISVELFNPKNEVHPIQDLMDGCSTIDHVRRLCEDLVKILIKLKSPGTKFLYLTRRKQK